MPSEPRQMTLAARLFQRSLQEKLAFVPLGKAAQQSPGPGGAPVDPAAAAGAPMDPGMGGAPPMDPAMGGAPMDPGMAGAPPMDPAMAGAPPMDPAMAGGAPMDPAMGPPPMDPMAMGGMPPLPPPPAEDANQAETDVDDNGKPDTMVPLEGMKDFTIGVIEAMKGRQTAPPKTQQEAAAQSAAAGAGAPGPVTGQPGFDPSMIPGPLKMASEVPSGIAQALTDKPGIPRVRPGARFGVLGAGAATLTKGGIEAYSTPRGLNPQAVEDYYVTKIDMPSSTGKPVADSAESAPAVRFQSPVVLAPGITSRVLSQRPSATQLGTLAGAGLGTLASTMVTPPPVTATKALLTAAFRRAQAAKQQSR